MLLVTDKTQSKRFVSVFLEDTYIVTTYWCCSCHHVVRISFFFPTIFPFFSFLYFLSRSFVKDFNIYGCFLFFCYHSIQFSTFGPYVTLSELLLRQLWISILKFCSIWIKFVIRLLYCSYFILISFFAMFIIRINLLLLHRFLRVALISHFQFSKWLRFIWTLNNILWSCRARYRIKPTNVMCVFILLILQTKK